MAISSIEHEPPLTRLEKDVLEYVNRNGRITNREVRQALDCTKTQAQLVPRQLKDRNLLKVYGAGRSTFYARCM